MLRTGADPTGGGAPYPLKAPAVCVVGSTASGKTDLAQALALELGGEVISADSMQIYRGMDIGTGKLPASERLVPHHGFDLVDPGEPFSAALFQNYARDRFRAIDARGNRCVLAGGTGFYVRAAVDDYDWETPFANATRPWRASRAPRRCGSCWRRATRPAPPSSRPPTSSASCAPSSC